VSVPGPGGDNDEDVDASEEGDETVDQWMESQNFAAPEPAEDEEEAGSPL
jgi:hypothetical protein